MASQLDLPLGLSNTPKSEWPNKPSERELEKAPIDRLKPKSDLHTRVLEYLLDRLRMSEREMSGFYSRWTYNEKRIQAYIDLPDYEKRLKEASDRGEPPQVVSIVVPYSYATIETIVTYLIQTFAGRKPMFQVGTYKPDSVEAAQLMETLLQFNADYSRLIKRLFQFFRDGEMYGVGILRCAWVREEKMRTVWQSQSQTNLFGQTLGLPASKVRERRLVYEGNMVDSVDPFMFFPDPRVPISEVNRRGEFVFWRNFEGRHTLKSLEADGVVKWVNAAGELASNEFSGESSRSIRAGGVAHPGMNTRDAYSGRNFVQLDQGTVEIIPRELGLGESERPEKWIFTIANKRQIIQAEPFDNDHDMHPVAVIEPYTVGYGFGHLGVADMVGPLQDAVSWFINSHIHNVRTALNNMFVVDPSKVEMQDLRKPGPGKIIRLKSAAFGQDVKDVFHQINVQDVTRAHIHDMEIFTRMADSVTSITDNLRGLQDSGGRKTATEVRTSGEAAASRLAAHARLISSQGMTDLTAMMALNIQQYQTEEMVLNVAGSDGIEKALRIAPEHVVGDFYFPVHDGTLPLDRVAMLDVWREIFQVVLADPQFRQQYDAGKIFEFIAELGGAKNLDQFKVQTQILPDEQVEQMAQAGNLAPARGGQTPGIAEKPGARLVR